MLFVVAVWSERNVDIVRQKSFGNEPGSDLFLFLSYGGLDFQSMPASFIEPWPLQPIPAAAIGQLIASDVLAVMMIVVSVSFVRELRRKT